MKKKDTKRILEFVRFLKEQRMFYIFLRRYSEEDSALWRSRRQHVDTYSELVSSNFPWLSSDSNSEFVFHYWSNIDVKWKEYLVKNRRNLGYKINFTDWMNTLKELNKCAVNSTE